MNKIKSVFLLITLLLPFSGQCQVRDYFIRFADRSQSPYSLQQPQQYLSQRAIARRTQQGILITTDDLPVNPSYVDSVVAQGAQLLNKVKWFNGITVRCDASVLPSIQALPFVAAADPIRRTSAPRIRKDLSVVPAPFMKQDLLRTNSLNYGDAFRQIRQLNADFLHDQQFQGQGVLIAVLDAGFNSADVVPAFDLLRSSNRIVATWDFVAQETSVFEDDAHGTSVLSCMAAEVPGQMIGTAPQASYLLLRTEDANSEYIIEEYNWAAAAAYADSAGADLISSSLGYTQFDDPVQDHVYADMDGNTCPASVAADIAAAKGLLVLVSAGNQGSSFWHYISAPSDADSVLAVGAVDSLGYMASFSSWGPSSDGRVKPDVAAMGRRATVSFFDGSFGTSNGTSFSCPILAGAAACLWQAHPSKSNLEVLNAIRQSASYYLTPGDSLGYGIPDFMAAHLQLGGTVLELPVEDRINSVYPNPFTERMSVDFFSTRAQVLTLTLFDLSGRMVYNGEEDAAANSTVRLEVQVPDLAAGSYLLRIDSSERTFVREVQKIR